MSDNKTGDNPTNTKKIPVTFGMSTDSLSGMVTSLGKSNGALSESEAIEISHVEVSGPMTVVQGEIVERILN